MATYYARNGTVGAYWNENAGGKSTVWNTASSGGEFINFPITYVAGDEYYLGSKYLSITGTEGHPDITIRASTGGLYLADATLKAKLLNNVKILLESGVINIEVGSSPNYNINNTIVGGITVTAGITVFNYNVRTASTTLTVTGDYIGSTTNASTGIHLQTNPLNPDTVSWVGNCYLPHQSTFVTGAENQVNGQANATFSFTGDVYILSTLGACFILNDSAFIVSSWVGDLYDTNVAVGKYAIDMSNIGEEPTVYNGQPRIDKWIGNLYTSGSQSAINLTMGSRITNWYGNCYNTGSAPAAISIGANCFIDNWYGNLSHTPTGTGIMNGVLLSGTISNWHGDIVLSDAAATSDAGTFVQAVQIETAGILDNFVGNLHINTGTISNCFSFWAAGFVFDNGSLGTINSWIGDMHVGGSQAYYGCVGIVSENAANGHIKSWIGDMYLENRYACVGMDGGTIDSWIGDAFVAALNTTIATTNQGVSTINSWTYFTDNNGQAEDTLFLSIQQGTTALHDLIHSRLPVIPPHIVASENVMYEEPRYQHAPTSMDGTLLSLDPLAANVLDTAGNYYINSELKIPALDSTKVLDPIGTLPKASVLKSSGGTLNANYSY